MRMFISVTDINGKLHIVNLRTIVDIEEGDEEFCNIILDTCKVVKAKGRAEDLQKKLCRYELVV